MSNLVFQELLAIFEEANIHLNQEQLAKCLQVSPGTVRNWHQGATPQKASLKKILDLYRDYHAKALIKPLVEFNAINPSQKGKTWNLTADKEETEKLRKTLEGHSGLYLFYDSAGKVIYVGKSEKCLYTEIRQRFNAVANRPFYGPTKMANPFMGNHTRFISAYEVTVMKAIKNLESFLLRSFANDIMNKNSGNFKDPI